MRPCCHPAARPVSRAYEVSVSRDGGIVSWQDEYYILSMAKYEISSGTDRDFNVKIVGNNGARQTMLGFPTREAAEAWILEDQRRSPVEDQPVRAGSLLP